MLYVYRVFFTEIAKDWLTELGCKLFFFSKQRHSFAFDLLLTFDHDPSRRNEVISARRPKSVLIFRIASHDNVLLKIYRSRPGNYGQINIIIQVLLLVSAKKCVQIPVQRATSFVSADKLTIPYRYNYYKHWLIPVSSSTGVFNGHRSRTNSWIPVAARR